MRQCGQSFVDLTSAWFSGSLDAIDKQTAEGHAGAFSNVAPVPPAPQLQVVPRVVVTRGMQLPPTLFESGALVSPNAADRVYQLESVLVASLSELEHRCHAHPPRVLIVDIELIKSAGVNELRHARRRLPATDWLMGCDTAVAGDIDLPVLAELQGCINWTTNPEQLARGLGAVVAGKPWFPRWMLEALYLELLDSHAPAQSAMRVDDQAKQLTMREAEVLKLMRHGLTNRQIAERIGISANTVKKHLAHVFEKRGLHGRRQELE